MEDWKIRIEEIKENDLIQTLSNNNSKNFFLYYFIWENMEKEPKEFLHTSQYEEYINTHRQKFPDSKLLKILDASTSERKIAEPELISILTNDGIYSHDFEIKWNNQPTIVYRTLKTISEYYSYKSLMTSGDSETQITEIYETRRTGH